MMISKTKVALGALLAIGALASVRLMLVQRSTKSRKMVRWLRRQHRSRRVLAGRCQRQLDGS